MKFLLCLCIILLISSYKSFLMRQKNSFENSYIMKMNENYYNKIGHHRIDEFKNMIFRELDQKSAVWDKHLKEIDSKQEKNTKIFKKSEISKINKNSQISEIKNIVKVNNINQNLTKSNRTNIIINDHEVAMKSHKDDYRTFAGEYISSNRVLKFYISHVQECSIFVNDTVMYENINNVNFVEHMILHNNAENIDPKGVYSEDVNINFFAFNRKLNIFSVYFEPKGSKGGLKINNNTNILKNQTINNDYFKKNSNFSIEYDYDALNIIKSNFNKEKENLNSSTYPDKELQNNSGNSFNSFIWKILNQNFMKVKENITLELYFDLGKEFEQEDIEFSLNFTKSILTDSKKSIVKYQWHGTIEPQEVIVLQAKFPLYFEHCGNLSINLVMIFVGAVFIVFLIGMLYIILSTVFTEDIF
jgi:hypothetical protein